MKPFNSVEEEEEEEEEEEGEVEEEGEEKYISMERTQVYL